MLLVLQALGDLSDREAVAAVRCDIRWKVASGLPLVVGALAAAELDEKAAQAVALLALIARQDVEPDDGSGGTHERWQIARTVAPDQVVSTVGSTCGWPASTYAA